MHVYIPLTLVKSKHQRVEETETTREHTTTETNGKYEIVP